jgi:hypothetical protein
LPEIDRCKKPAQQSFAPTRDNLPPKPTIKRNDESLSAVNLNEKESNNRPIHRVPTLGGARIIEYIIFRTKTGDRNKIFSDVVGPTPMPNSSTSQSRPTIPEKSIQQPMKIKYMPIR